MTNFEISPETAAMTRPWIVQKFGGTSVGKFPLQIARDIVNEYEKEARVVVVCSARSNNIKAQGTTTCLIRAADYAVSRSKDFKSVIHGIREDHLTAARETVGTDHPEILQELETSIEAECDQAVQILHASKILDEVSPRTLDLVLSVGEKLACLFMVSVLKVIGRNAKLVDFTRILSSIATSPGSSNSGNEEVKLDRAFYADLESKMAAAVSEAAAEGAVPVVTGFFGLIPGGLINNVGRGYTDLCAALCAVGLGAEELQIWKEVDGIFTADPRKVPTARLLDQITPEEAAELTYYGSEVIHPFTMDQVIRAHIPIRIKNVMKPKGAGTKVFPTETDSAVSTAGTKHPPLQVTPSFVSLAERHKGPTAITSKGNIVVLNIISNRTRQSHGFLAQVFRILDKWRLVVDLISTSEVHVSMAIHESTPDTPITEALREIRQYGTVDVTENLSIVSLVGTHMKQFVGIAAKMFTTLADAGVNIEMISQGSSEINISCVIDAREVQIAINAMHEKLLNNNEPLV